MFLVGDFVSIHGADTVVVIDTGIHHMCHVDVPRGEGE
jgi:hypothetical protein